MTDANPAPLRAKSVQGAAEALSVSERTVWRMIRAGDIRSVKIGQRRIVVPESEIARLLDGQAA